MLKRKWGKFDNVCLRDDKIFFREGSSNRFQEFSRCFQVLALLFCKIVVHRYIVRVVLLVVRKALHHQSIVLPGALFIFCEVVTGMNTTAKKQNVYFQLVEVILGELRN